MKILFITDLYPIKSGENNSPRTLHNFVLEWKKQGHGVDVVKPNFVFNSLLRGKTLYKTGFFEFEGVRIFNVNYFTPFLFDIEKKLPGEFDLKNYDLIVAHMPSGIIFANNLNKTRNIPLVCAVHSSDIEVLTSPVYKFYFKPKLEEAYSRAKKIACRSFVLQKKFARLYPDFAEKTFVAASGVTMGEKRKWEMGKEDPSTVKVLTCANLIKRKNIDKLILALKDLEGFELTIIGEGRELNRLKKLNRLGFATQQNQINFLGKLPQKEVFEQMQNSHIFVLPSERETFGMVYLEAMANGCITVCTEEDGIDGIIKDGENGFLTPPTVEGIRKTLLKIKTANNLEKIRKNSLETVKNYSPEICAQNYLQNCQ